MHATITVLLLAASAAAPADLILDWEVVSRRAHDPEAYTQGLLLDEHGALFESTGRYGHSTLREVDGRTGVVLRSTELADEYFGEGLALVDGRFIQLTYRSGIAQVRDAATFELLDQYAYDGEGWGLCYDGERLLMSDGSDTLTFRDPATFDIVGSVEVTLSGAPLDALNELECVDGSVWANVYRTDRIVRIDPASGIVDGVLDLTGIIDPAPTDSTRGAVLNGIAYDPRADTFLVTGKYWPELIEIRVEDGDRG